MGCDLTRLLFGKSNYFTAHVENLKLMFFKASY